MRIIAGTARSLPLKTIEGLETRPTTDKIKETLFNMLQNDVPGCYFLDLFAGSGQIGLEAISRGALYAVFIENNRKAAKCIEDNIAFTKFKSCLFIFQNSSKSSIVIDNKSSPQELIMVCMSTKKRNLSKSFSFALNSTSNV